jgi:NodT family efflux transporter outer membrane factor (OMF) lipoprotein
MAARTMRRHTHAGALPRPIASATKERQGPFWACWFHGHDRMRMRVVPPLVGVLVLITGCASVGPDYRTPSMDQPDAYPVETTIASRSTSSPDPHEASRPLARWWTAFGDERLDALLERGLTANHDVQIAAARIRQARAELGIATAAFGPTVNADAGVTRIHPTQDGPIPFPLSPFTLYDAGFDASWELDIWGAVRREREAASADLDATTWTARGVAISVTAEIVRAYVSLQAAAQRLHIAQAVIALRHQQSTIAYRLFRDGLAPGDEVSRALGALDRAEALVPPLQADVTSQSYRLAVLLGQDPGALDAEVADPVPLPDLPGALEAGVPADLLRRRPDLHAAERRLAAATARVGVAEADFYPRLSLDGTFGLASVSTSTLVSKAAVMWSVGPSVRWRLLDWGRTAHGVDAAHAAVDVALISYDGALRQAEEEVATQMCACGQDRLRADALDRNVIHAAVDERIARSLHDRGLVSDRRVLDAVDGRLAAEDHLVSARLAMAIDTVSLAKALGGGWEPGTAPAAVHRSLPGDVSVLTPTESHP